MVKKLSPEQHLQYLKDLRQLEVNGDNCLKYIEDLDLSIERLEKQINNSLLNGAKFVMVN